LQFHDWPPLPYPHAMGGAAVLDGVIYVAAGLSSPTATEAEAALFALDTRAPHPEWSTLEPLPGAARILPVVAAQSGSLYVLSGASLHPGPDGTPRRTYLTDG